MILPFNKVFYCIFLLIQIFSWAAYSQEKTFPYKDIVRITEENGLSNNNVNQIMQDKDGFMWFATYYGLDRYDGVDFKIFNYDPSRKYSISPGYFSGSMKQDRRGLIWLSSDNVGVYSFDPRSENAVQYRHIPGNKHSLADDLTYDLCIDSNGLIWIATQNGLDVYDSQKKEFQHFLHFKNDSSSISDNIVLSVCSDTENNLYLITAAGGIDYFNTKTGKVIDHYDNLPSVTPEGDLQNRIHHISCGKSGNLWISGTAKGVTGFNIKGKKWIYYSHDDSNSNSVSSNAINTIFEDHEENLWVGTEEGGVDFLKHGTNNFYHLNLKTKSLQPDIAAKFFEDDEHNIWAAFPNGIVVIHTLQKSFECFIQDTNSINSLTNNYVGAFNENNDGTFLIGSSGVDIFQPKTGVFKPMEAMQNGRNILSGKSIIQIYQDTKGVNWFATENGGLISYNSKTKISQSYVHDVKDLSSIGAESCTGIIEDLKGRYWMTVYTGGLEAFDPESGKFRMFNVNAGNNSISTNSVGNIMCDSKGVLYIGSFDGGLITFNPDNEKFKIYHHHPEDSYSLSSNNVSDFAQASSGIIWIGTMGGGLNAFNPVTGKFRSFTTHDGLCSDGIQSLTIDNNGNIWIGTINGISCFTPPDDAFNKESKFHFRNYNVNDGIAGNVMSFFAAYKSKNGLIYFGTDGNGMFRFNPNDLKENKYLPSVLFTDFKLFNISIKSNDSTKILQLPIEDVKEIKLNYDQNVISFSFAALNYIHPEKNQYAYILEGFDKEWFNTTSLLRFANYTNLNPGQYIFKVRGSNNDGIWNPIEASIKLLIYPPYWKTWWFILLLFTILVSLAYSLYKFRLNQMLRLHQVRNKISSDLHDDLGSTLSSISIYTELARKQSKEHLPILDKIGESARKMIESMSDIVWAINPENDSFEMLVDRMRSFTYEMLALRDIKFTFDVENKFENIKISMDKRKNIFLVFKEVIHNLIKYSNADQASVKILIEENQIFISIQDNGKGFDPEIISKGNGLKNMKSRVKEIRGDLKIESEHGKGTIVELKLKIK